MNRRRVYNLIFYAVAFVALATSANAQSKDRDNPTKLKSNEISGLVDSDTRGSFYFYSFMANPGEVVVTLTVEPGRSPDSGPMSLTFTGVGFRLYDRNAEEIAGKGVMAGTSQGPKQAVARVEITRRQPVVLGIEISQGPVYKSVGGKYRLRISGTVELGDDEPTSRAAGQDPIVISQKELRQMEDGTFDYLNILPKKGTMIIKMKDGSNKIIDLSEAQKITIVP